MPTLISNINVSVEISLPKSEAKQSNDTITCVYGHAHFLSYYTSQWERKCTRSYSLVTFNALFITIIYLENYCNANVSIATRFQHF